MRFIAFVILTLLFVACTAPAAEPQTTPTGPSLVKIASAMRNVMWKGELEGKISLDTISQRDHLYALGPVSYLRGEIMAVDGKVYVSRVTSDSTMTVKEEPDVSAPFLVYANTSTWGSMSIPDSVTTIKDLEAYLDDITQDFAQPFVFRLNGTISKAKIHVQNLPEGTRVSSPKEAHQGQVKFPVTAGPVTIVGFFSTEHQGVFTHHDTFLHLHLLTQDKTMMGHVDELMIERMELSLGL